MGLTLNITAGNDKRVVLWLLNGLHDEGREPFPVELSEDVAVKMVSEVGTRHAVSFVVGDEGRVLLDLKGSDYKIGLWGIEVVGRLNGAKWRAYGDSMIHYTPTTERGAEQVTVAADTDELTLVVGYATDIVPRKTSELVNDGADGEHPFATEEQLKRYAPLNSPTFTGYPIYSDSNQSVEAFYLTSFLASKNWVYRFVEWFKTQTNGIASLEYGKVPAAQIPDLPYIKQELKGKAGGVAELNGERRVWNDQLAFAYRGEWQTSQDIDATDIEPGMYFLKGNVSWPDILDGEGANGVLVQYPDNYKTQVLMVGRAANAEAGEQVETYTRRRLNAAGRWTAWSKGGNESGNEVVILNVNYSSNTYTCEKDYYEIKELLRSGKIVILMSEYRLYFPFSISLSNSYITYTSLSLVGKRRFILRSFVSLPSYGKELVYYENVLDEMSLTEAKNGVSTLSFTISAKVLKQAILYHTSDKANADDVYTKSEADERFQPKGNYLTEHQDISGKQDVQQTAVYTAASTAEDFHPMELGSLQEGENSWTLYKFFFKVDNLPNNTSLVVSLAQLLADYTIGHIVSVHGVTSSGHFVSSGRTDDLSKVCVAQQGSRLRKEITLRTYADLSSDSATLLIEFYGTKDA